MLVRRVLLWPVILTGALGAPALGEPPAKEALPSLPSGALACFGDSEAGRGAVAVEQMVFSRDGSILAAIRGNRVQLWDLKTGKEIHWPAQGDGRGTDAVSIAISPDGKTLASSCLWDTTIRLRDLATGKDLVALTGSENSMLAYAPDGKTLATSSVRFFRGRCGDLSGGDGTLRLWDAALGKELWRREDIGSGCLAFSPDGKALAVSRQGAICLLQSATGATRLIFGRENESNFHVAYSPDGKFLASAGRDPGSGHINRRLWEVATGKELCAFGGSSTDGWKMAFVPHSRRIVASQLSEGCIGCWDPLAGTDSVVGRAAPATLAFSRDGRLLATGGSKDGTIVLWDAAKLLPAQRPKAFRLSASQLPVSWDDLAGDDAGKAYRAMGQLVAAGEQAVPFLQAHIRVVQAVPPGRLVRLLADLDSNRFAVRKRATEELEQLAELAEPCLRQALARSPSLEMHRRIEQILVRLDNRAWTPPAEQLPELRALIVLEQIDTPRARRLLAALAEGAAGARLTREARSGLARLEQRSAGP